MPNNYFITGVPRAGKTTLLRRIAKRLKEQGLKVGGFISPEESEHGTRKGFFVEDISSGNSAILADINIDGPKVAKYHVDIRSFESIALPSMSRFKDLDIIIVDEIGMMELKSQKFSDLLDSILESDTALIASLHNDLIERYGPYGEVMYLTEDTREFLYIDLVRKVATIKGGKKKLPMMMPQKPDQAMKKPIASAVPQPPSAARGKETEEKTWVERPWEEAEKGPSPQEMKKRREKKKGEIEEFFGEEQKDETEEKEEGRKGEKKKGKKRSFIDSLMDLLGL